jgi:hypothetical protein
VFTERRGQMVSTSASYSVPGSNLGPETGYPDRGFRGFPHSFHANVVIVP